MIKGIIFDKDGTLFDNERLYVKGWLEAIKKAGGPSDDSIILGNIGLNYDAAMKRLRDNYGKYGLDDIIKGKEKYVNDYITMNGYPLKPHSKAILDFLHNKNIKISLATSARFDEAILYLKSTDLLGYFDAIVSGDMVVNGKPDPEIFLLAADKLGLDPSECMVVEDSMHGINGAKKGGFISCYIPDINKANDTSMCDYVLTDLIEIINVING